jgi:tetratricopeptide (TPR) repeat protein
MESALREAVAAQPEVVPQPSTQAARRAQFTTAFLATAAVLVALIAGLIVWTGRPAVSDGPSVKSLAVLPLVAKSSSSSTELTDAMTEQLIATIGQIDSLRTTSLLSVLPFKGTMQPRNDIAKVLGVDAVVDGVLTVVDGERGGPGSLQLDVNLIAAGSGAKVWSGSFMRPRGEAAALLAQTASELAAAVKAPIKTDEASRLRQVRRTSPAAEEAYLQGRLYLSGYGPEPARRALTAFQRALTLDPGYAAAHAGAALAYVKLGGFNVLSHQDARVSAQAEIRKAFESGEDIAEAHAADADIKFLYDWDWDGAVRGYQRSLDLNPSFIHARNNYAQVLAARKRFDESLTISEDTLRMDPQSAEALVSHGMLLYYKRDYRAAEEMSQRVITLEPNNASAYFLRSRVAEAQGRYADALGAANQARQLAGTASVNLQVVIIRLQALAGMQDAARAAAADLEKAGATGALRVHPRDLAYLYLGLGRTEAALGAFEAAFDERDPSLVWLTVEPRVDGLRSNPRFQKLLQKLGLD